MVQTGHLLHLPGLSEAGFESIWLFYEKHDLISSRTMFVFKETIHLKFYIFQAQEKRGKVLSHFKSGSLDFIVCTDALARGIDIG